MRLLDAAQVDAALDDLALVDRLEATFRAGVEMPVRHHHAIPAPTGPGSTDALLLLMPAWTMPPRERGQPAGRIGIKVATVFPDNGLKGLPAVCAQYLLLDGGTGEPLALLDGAMLTKRRTACASGLASRFLSRSDSRRLLMIGTGALAPELIRVHCKLRPIEEVAIWGRTAAHAEALASRLAQSLPGSLGRPVAVRAVTDRAAAVSAADIISCATLSRTPLVEGAWLRPGQHVDLIGAYTPDMRESDDAAVRMAQVFVDTRAGALKEAGDIVQPLQADQIEDDDVLADLYELSRGQHRGREPGDGQGITLFKSVGAALEDLAAAELAIEQAPP
jgi:ornithine cyclodeaminase